MITKKFRNEGSSFEAFLEEEGILKDVDKLAKERVRAWLAVADRRASSIERYCVRRSRSNTGR